MSHTANIIRLGLDVQQIIYSLYQQNVSMGGLIEVGLLIGGYYLGEFPHEKGCYLGKYPYDDSFVVRSHVDKKAILG